MMKRFDLWAFLKSLWQAIIDSLFGGTFEVNEGHLATEKPSWWKKFGPVIIIIGLIIFGVLVLFALSQILRNAELSGMIAPGEMASVISQVLSNLLRLFLGLLPLVGAYFAGRWHERSIQKKRKEV